MRKLLGVLVVVMASACGPAWTGKVSGYSMDVKEALFATLSDSKGSTVGALVVVSNQTSLCAQLAATKAPPSATLAAFTLFRKADGNLLSPDVGDYIVQASNQAGASAQGTFVKTDANSTNSIPANNRYASSGLFQVTEFSTEKQTMAIHFEGKFGAQNDSVTMNLRAIQCTIGTQTLLSGFLGRGESSLPPNSNTGGYQSQSAVCADFIACYKAYNAGGTTTSYDSTYGPNGSCWTGTSATADACTSACSQALASYRQSSSAPSACFQ